MATIDNLSIQVTASAESAASALDRLASSAGRLRGAATQAGGGLRDLAAGAKDAGTATQEAGQQAGNAEKHTRNYGRAAEEAGKAAKRGTAGISSFWQALKRVAYYRFVRTIIKSITEAFKEGITNAYNYSKTINGTFAKSMDKLATSTLYLKNSLGAMMTPIINTLAPIIEWIIDGIVTIINWLNKLFAALSGSQTYMVAKKVATTWGDAASSAASSASEAADEIKRTILGFDEINKLEKENVTGGDSSSGSGSGSGGPSASSMFEEKQLDGWMKKLSDFINTVKEKLEPVKQWFSDFGDKLKNIWDGFVEGAKDFFSDPVDWLKTNVTDPIVGGLKNLLGISSPSTEMKIIGGYLIDGLKLGMADGLKDIDSWIKNNIVDPIKQAFSADGGTSLYFSPKLDNQGGVLYNQFKKQWDDAGSKTLYLSPKLDNGADTLYANFKSEWDAQGSKVLYFSPKLDNTAKTLFENFKKAWDAIESLSLYMSPKLDNTADALFNTFKAQWNTGDRSVTVKVTPEWDSNGFGGATGGGGSTAGGGAGRFNVPVSFSAPTPEEASNLFGRLKEAWNAGVVAVDKGLNVVVRPVAKKAGDLLSSYYGKIGEWLFGTGESPETNVTVSGNAGTGPGPLWNALTGNGETDVVVDAYGNMMFVPKSGNGITVNENEELSLTKPMGARLQAQNTPTDVFGGGANNPLSFFGSLIKKDKNNTAKKLFGGGSTMNYYGTLKKKDKKYAPGKVFENNSLFKYFGLLTKQNASQSPQIMFEAGSIYSYFAELVKNWTGTPQKALGLDNLKAQIKIDLVKGSKDTVSFEIHGGGTGKGTVSMQTKKRGGIFSNGSWKDIPQYANGTTNAHGSMFLAGEAGPELVGHLGGRTEVLNQSQLAATMFSAVRAAMGGVKIAATMYSGSVGGDESDYETMYRAMYDAFTDAMSGSEQRDREKVALMREIATKEFTAEVSAQSVNRANTRLNRRAGMTIVPVGT